jgi:hypothetical protein
MERMTIAQHTANDCRDPFVRLVPPAFCLAFSAIRSVSMFTPRLGLNYRIQSPSRQINTRLNTTSRQNNNNNVLPPPPIPGPDLPPTNLCPQQPPLSHLQPFAHLSPLSHLLLTPLHPPPPSIQTTPTLTPKLATRAINSTHVRPREFVAYDCCAS